MLQAAILIVFPLCMAVTAVSDTLSMTIPNRVSVILVAAFVLIAPFAGMGWPLIGMHLLAGLVVFLVCFALFAMNIMGGGDAKVLTAAAVWFGLGSNLLLFLVTTSFVGGLLTIGFILIRSRGDLLLASRIPFPAHFYDNRAGIPYGIAIGIAGFLCYPQTQLMAYALQQLS